MATTEQPGIFEKLIHAVWNLIGSILVLLRVPVVVGIIDGVCSRIYDVIVGVVITLYEKIKASSFGQRLITWWQTKISPRLNNKAKFKIAVIFAVLFALTQAWILKTIITGRELNLDTSDRIRISADFISANNNENLLTDLKLLKPQEKPPPPPALDQDFSKQSADNTADSVGVNLGNVGKIDVQLGSGIGAGEGEYIPIVKVAPIYPQGALSRGVQGYCTVEYTVTEIGTVVDPVVVPGECTSSLFERASKKASRKFKYKPRVVDGVAVQVPGVRNRFTYTIEK